MKEIGSKTKPKEEENSKVSIHNTERVQYTKANGKKISRTEKESRLGQMDPNTKATTPIPRKKGGGSSSGPTVLPLLAISIRTRSMVKAPINGQMGRCIRGNGRTI